MKPLAEMTIEELDAELAARAEQARRKAKQEAVINVPA
jgi:hypothetical protein